MTRPIELAHPSTSLRARRVERLEPVVIDTALTRAWTQGSQSGYVEKVGTASRSLQLTAQQISSLDVVYEGSGTPPVWLINPDPSYYNDVSDALFAVVWSIYARGDAPLWVTSRRGDGYPNTWVALDPVTFDAKRTERGIEYRSNGVLLDPNDVLLLRRNNRPGLGSLRGVSALESHWSTFRSAFASELYAANVFERSGVPGAVIKYKGPHNAAKAKELQDQWVTAVGGRLGAPAIIPEGMDYGVLTFSPRDLMLLELREYDARQVAAAYGVPAFLLNLPQADGLTYTTTAQLFDLWWRSELWTTARRIQRAISNVWLPRPTRIRFDPNSILTPSLPDLAAMWATLKAAGAVTVDELRAAVLGLGPMPAAAVPEPPAVEDDEEEEGET